MLSKSWKSVIIFWILWLTCFIITWCKHSTITKYQTEIITSDLSLTYNWEIQLSKIIISNNDLEEITDVYEEVWNNTTFKDSLIIAEKSTQYGINTFVQDNLDFLEIQWLEIKDTSKIQIWLKRDGKIENTVLVEYSIQWWFTSETPVLYVSQFFIPYGDKNVKLFSFISESKSARDSASKMFKQIK